MKYCDDCTSATWCYDQQQCDRKGDMIEVSASALESIKAMCERLQAELDELLFFALEASQFFEAYSDGAMSRNNAENIAGELHTDAKNLIAKCTQEQ